MNITDTISELINREGGYTNNPNDKGGETTWGITVAVARAFGYMGPMNAMTQQVARDIYAQRYWHAPRFSDVAAFSELVAEELLDTGVNMGPSVAGKFLQRALNVLNQGDKLYPNTTVDGSVGNMTIAALKAFLTARGKDGETVLVRMLNAQQSVRYIELAEANATQESFEYGWQLNRVKGL
jgi:lysozyme family protein